VAKAREYRIVVQRKVGPNTWQKEFAIHGEASSPNEALALASQARNHPALKRPSEDAPNYRAPDGEAPRYPNISVKLSGALGKNAFAMTGQVRHAMKQAGVAPAEVGRFLAAAAGSGLDRKVNDAATVYEICRAWVVVT
jgi:hypothetical protein